MTPLAAAILPTVVPDDGFILKILSGAPPVHLININLRSLRILVNGVSGRSLLEVVGCDVRPTEDELLKLQRGGRRMHSRPVAQPDATDSLPLVKRSTGSPAVRGVNAHAR